MRRLIVAAALLLLGTLAVSCRSKDDDEPPAGPNHLVPPMLLVFTGAAGKMVCFPVGTAQPGFERDLGLRAVQSAVVNRVGDRLFAVDGEFNLLRICTLPGLTAVQNTIVGGNPVDLDISGSAGIAYILTRNANFWRYSVSGRTFDTLETGLQPRRFALRPTGNSEAWVACMGDNTIRILDLGLFRTGDTIFTNDPPTDIAFSPDGAMAYVAIGGATQSVVTYHAGNRSELLRRAAGPGPNDLAVSADGRFLCAADSSLGRVQIWATNRQTPIAEIDSIPEAGHPVFSSRNRMLYVNSPLLGWVFGIQVGDTSAAVTDTFATNARTRTIALWENSP